VSEPIYKTKGKIAATYSTNLFFDRYTKLCFVYIWGG